MGRRWPIFSNWRAALPLQAPSWPSSNRHVPPGVKGALALQALNPKAYAVNTALFTGFPILPDQPFVESLIKFASMNVIWVPIHLTWLWAVKLP